MKKSQMGPLLEIVALRMPEDGSITVPRPGNEIRLQRDLGHAALIVLDQIGHDEVKTIHEEHAEVRNRLGELDRDRGEATGTKNCRAVYCRRVGRQEDGRLEYLAAGKGRQADGQRRFDSREGAGPGEFLEVDEILTLSQGGRIGRGGKQQDQTETPYPYRELP